MRNLALLFRPDSFLFWKLGLGAYGGIALDVSRLIMLVTMASYLVVMTLAIPGAAACRERGRASFLVSKVG